ESNIVSVAFYDRRNDPVDNLLFEYFQVTSPDGGATWLPNVRVSDVQSPVVAANNLATCYHGDYDTHIQIAGAAILQWADDRNGNADTFSDIVALGTDFLVIPGQASLDVCAPQPVTVDLDVLQFNAFAESVTLASNAWPAGLTAGFSQNPVTPPATSQLTISGTGGAGFGSFPLNVTGTSAPSNIVQDADLTLNVFTQTPPQPTLTAPADGATDVGLTPALSWNAATEASTYTVEIATDPAFTNIVFQTTSTSTDATPGSSLASSTEHYWRVRATNICDTSANSTVFSFVTEALPGDCPLGTSLSSLFTDDFEAGAGGWTTGGNGDTWEIQTASAQSGTQAFQADDVAQISDQYLISPLIALPAAADPLNLLFWTRHIIEPNGSNCYDGGVLEISTDGASTWQRLENEIELEAYDGVVNDGFDNPISGDNAWCGTREWTRFVVDLTAFAGQNARFRFRLATDSSASREGWYIDDVSIATCDTSDIFSDGFESGDTTAWQISFP
ncbi:MAG: choice-of-anchor J domain-containing protein, partial [Acidobacteriota bacterium]